MDTTAIRTTRRLVQSDSSGFPAFQAAALEFADKHREEALRTCAELYVSRGASQTQFPPLAGYVGVAATLEWALERPEHTPERRMTAIALALAAIPQHEYGMMTAEEQYISTHAALEKTIEAKNAYTAELAWLIATSETRERREKTMRRLFWAGIIIAPLIVLWALLR